MLWCFFTQKSESSSKYRIGGVFWNSGSSDICISLGSISGKTLHCMTVVLCHIPECKAYMATGRSCIAYLVVGSDSHCTRTALEFVWNRAAITSSKGIGVVVLVCT